MRTQSNSAHTHTTGSSNREALQATKVLAHDEQTLEKHALLNAHSTAWPRVQEEVVQNKQRDVVTQAWGKYPRLLLRSLYLKTYP